MKHNRPVSLSTIERFCQIQKILNQLQPDAEPQARVISGSPYPYGNILVFPSSFNPPTTAHLALLKQAQHFTSQDGQETGGVQVYAAMSKLTVNKEHVERPLFLDRLLLLQTLLRHRLPRTGIMLFNRGLYVEEAEAVRACFPRVKKVYFLIGFDKIVQILDPRYYGNRDEALRELFASAQLLVAPRGTSGTAALEALLAQPQNVPFARFIHPFPLGTAYCEVSSTQVRTSPAAHHRDIPYEVRAFMEKTRAYTPPVKSPDGTTIDYYEQRVQRLQRLLTRVDCEM